MGYQAIGTLGRHIVDGAKKARILGQKHRVRARVERINGFSAHADKNELFKWLSAFQKPSKGIFVTHGEPEAARHFADFLKAKAGWETSVPNYQEKVLLD